MITFNDMSCKLAEYGISSSVIKTLPDMAMTAVFHKPMLNLFAFDDYLHQKYGKYENEEKSMRDMFNELFGKDAKEIASYFGVH